MNIRCCDPKAPVEKCNFCNKIVYTCELENPINNDYRCPLHKDGFEDAYGKWFCSGVCWDNYYNGETE